MESQSAPQGVILPVSEKQPEFDQATLECQFEELKPSRFTRLKSCKLYDIVLISFSIISALYMATNLVSFVYQSRSSSTNPITDLVSPDLSARDLKATTFGDESFVAKHHWGTISEYYTGGSNFPGIEGDGLGIPEQCSLDQIHVLHRHAERYPASYAAKPMKAIAKKLKTHFENSTYEPLPPFEWLKTWNYTLGTELLTPKGVATEFSSGSKFWSDYGQALFKTDQQFYSPKINTYSNGTQRPIPVIRAPPHPAWAAGFFGQYAGQPYTEKDASKLYELVLQDETDGNNNTMASWYTCSIPDDKFPGLPKVDEWVNYYLNETVIRLQNYLPGINLTNTEVYNMQQICTFETASIGYSSFCDLFSDEEWQGYEYVDDLEIYYWDSFGSGEYATVFGAGWASEFIARLEGKLITTPANGVNVTLTNNTETFPVNQPFYLDMSHDLDIIFMLTVMDLDFLKQELSSTSMDPARQFMVSRLVPFGARLVFEVLGCGSDRYIRAKLNDRVLPLGSMKYCPKDSEGLCPFNDFVKSLKASIESIDFDKLCTH
ncbi:phosphoglycerate mutase-like protein [Nadsonia fulvescens var. elongata DSM 6958]|uniref:Phosphoglycerate mutase-like protein n=1 Tax=Nadsonia fulvescens var. elongata DSM 6958 TaxID=857566 RepID=A0A1E3PRR9_9ASCO|nr:phosphoglycerate mutase-like protein [Nadsonia fulvescens var. elongata DSM 6958]